MGEIRLTMVRHGQSQDNAAGVYSREDSPLTDQGKEQIRAIRSRLQAYSFDRVYSSTLKRARQSLDLLGLEAELEPRIRETDFGIFQGKSYEDLTLVYPDEIRDWAEDYQAYRIPQGESLVDSYKRLVDFLEDVDTDSLIVCHGGIIRLAFCYALGSLDYFYSFRVDPASISQIILSEDYTYISKVNEGAGSTGGT